MQIDRHLRDRVGRSRQDRRDPAQRRRTSARRGECRPRGRLESLTRGIFGLLGLAVDPRRPFGQCEPEIGQRKLAGVRLNSRAPEPLLEPGDAAREPSRPKPPWRGPPRRTIALPPPSRTSPVLRNPAALTSTILQRWFAVISISKYRRCRYLCWLTETPTEMITWHANSKVRSRSSPARTTGIGLATAKQFAARARMSSSPAAARPNSTPPLRRSARTPPASRRTPPNSPISIGCSRR